MQELQAKMTPEQISKAEARSQAIFTEMQNRVEQVESNGL